MERLTVGVTAGATYAFDDLPAAPRLTPGHAWISGDDDPADNRNTMLRQTGLHSNRGSFGKGGKLNHGEAFDPGLSNMSILTHEPGEAWELQPALGYFRPGHAYRTAGGSRADSALHARVEVEYHF